MNSASPGTKPLSGVRILTMEQFAAAPYGSLFLADLGAEVIKIENPQVGGDAARRGLYPMGEDDSLYYQGWNTNKKSVTIDLKTEEGQRQFHKLVRTADAVMNNMRGDQPAKLGLDYAALKEVNPAIVCGHISAYGRDNERAPRPGYDYLMQAEAGLMSLTGDPEGDPSRFGPSIIDFMSGMVLVTGLLACLVRARETGQGCDVDTSLFEVALHQLNYNATWYLNEGLETTRQPRSAHYSFTPVQTYKASDGWLYVMCMTDKFWRHLVTGMGREDLVDNPLFDTMEKRTKNRDALTEVLDAEFSQHPKAYWVEKLGGKAPIGPVNTVSEALENPFVKKCGLVRDVPHPLRSDMKLLANPLRIDGQHLSQEPCAPLGANNGELLEEE